MPYTPPALTRHGSAVVLDGQAVMDVLVAIAIAARSAEFRTDPRHKPEFRRRVSGLYNEFRAAVEHHINGAGDLRCGDEPQDYSSLITTAEAARLSGLSQRHCRELASRNGIGSRRRGRWLIDPDLLIEHVARQQIGRDIESRTALGLPARLEP